MTLPAATIGYSQFLEYIFTFNLGYFNYYLFVFGLRGKDPNSSLGGNRMMNSLLLNGLGDNGYRSYKL